MIKNPALNWVRLPLESIDNCRELGGYNTAYGQQTKWHELLRSSDMSKLTEEDIMFLKEYGVKTVIDLRGEDEIQEKPNVLAKEAFCHYYNFPFITEQVSNIIYSSEKRFMGDFYIELLEENKVLQDIFHLIAHAEEGTIIFHCAGGKDRTGILAMMLLSLAGVEKKDIISNYEVSYTNLKTMHTEEDLPEGIPVDYMYSKGEYMEKAYEYLTATYESVEQYLLAKGVEQEVITLVKNRLVDQDSVVTV
ncbi:tyrosine-protein phosphatase [Gracilibacillus caseinilyticus]|uniref:Tyrosine-protein phosphatase n=1 Tax=Gracilibacillus caseinilyticus TaxID=2932256 RepID=A0ABY4EWR2_9BACI|nr:tyrosine-protein phosphatase [Gracilibacillus caseinilyticus]UOQ48724.1 tyrosine-protein phosphatase [Gracilibacillus caseinilyticus]